MVSVRGFLVLLFVCVAQAAVSRKRARDRPPQIRVTGCRENTGHGPNAKYVAGHGPYGRKLLHDFHHHAAVYIETVEVFDARPNRNVFLTYHKDVQENGARHSFNTDCGNIQHVGLGVATDMMVDLARITSGRKLTKRASHTGKATFEIPVNVCGKMTYEGFDWITSENCQKTPQVKGTAFTGTLSHTHDLLFDYGHSNENPLEMMFDYIDSDGNGHVDRDEFDGFVGPILDYGGINDEYMNIPPTIGYIADYMLGNLDYGVDYVFDKHDDHGLDFHEFAEIWLTLMSPDGTLVDLGNLVAGNQLECSADDPCPSSLMFCNFDHGDHGFCEICHEAGDSAGDCYTNGLSRKGANDCAQKCAHFMTPGGG